MYKHQDLLSWLCTHLESLKTLNPIGCEQADSSGADAASAQVNSKRVLACMAQACQLPDSSCAYTASARWNKSSSALTCTWQVAGSLTSVLRGRQALKKLLCSPTQTHAGQCPPEDHAAGTGTAECLPQNACSPLSQES